MAKLEYNSEELVVEIRDLKNIFIYSDQAANNYKYILEVGTETVIKCNSVMDIKTLLNIVFIIL